MEEAAAFLDRIGIHAKEKLLSTIYFKDKSKSCQWVAGVSGVLSPGNRVIELTFDAAILRDEENHLTLEDQWSVLTIEALVMARQPTWERVEYEFQMCRRPDGEIFRLFARVTLRSRLHEDHKTLVLARWHKPT